MEYGNFGASAEYEPVLDASYSAPASEEQSEFAQRLDFIRTDALNIGADWHEATGGQSIEQAQYEVLCAQGYTSYSSAQLAEAFSDWPAYQSASEHFLAARIEERQEIQTQLLEAAKLECKLGILPEVMLQEAIPYFIKYNEVADKPKDNNKARPRKLQRYAITPNQAKVPVILKRYARYVVASKLLDDRPSGKPVSESLKINIALGFAPDTGIAVSSYIGSLKKSSSELGEIDIERAAEETCLYDFIYPDKRKADLSKMVALANEQPETEAPKQAVYIEPLDLNGLDDFRLALLGSDPIKSVAKANERLRAEWDNQKFLEYGHFIMQLTEGDLSVGLLSRAAKLGMGPGVGAIEARFDCLSNFYRQLGMTTKNNPRGVFDNWTTQNFIEYIKLVAGANNGQISERILRGYARNAKNHGLIAPTVSLIKLRGGKISELVKEAGAVTAPNHRSHMQEYVETGLDYVRENNRLPTKRNFGKDGLPSTNTIHNRFGGIKNYQKVLTEALQRLSEMAA